MNAEIISIGDELLIGQVINTNSSWIAQQLNLLGIGVERIVTVPDEETAIIRAFEAACTHAGLVFVTGGLGPTNDDVTKKAFAEFAGTVLEMNEDILKEVSAYFIQRGSVLTDINRQHALFPKGAEVVANSNGTAPGIWMKVKGSVFICMPGVPYEMKSMMTERILPRIAGAYDLPVILHKTVLTQGISESALAELIAGWEKNLRSRRIRLAYLPQPGVVRLRLTATGAAKTVLVQTMDQELSELRSKIEEYILGYEEFGEEEQSPQKALSNLLHERGETMSVAESCTGGFLSSLFTAIPGASVIFKGSVVPYSNAMKHELLGVDEKIFTTVGAVSRECVEELAINVREKFDSDYSISISGIAGPSGATPEKPVGLVWIGYADRKNVYSEKFTFGEDRQRNIILASVTAVNLLRKHILRSSSTA